jgi:F-type H+-transporting ATPase subunit b
MLDINETLLLVTLVVFLFLIATLNKGMFIPVLNFMRDRDAGIAKDLAEASKNSDDINHYINQADEILFKAKQDIASLRDNVIESAKKLAESKLEAKRNELTNSFEEFKTSLNAEEKELKTTLTAQIPLYKEGLKAKVSSI